MRDPLEKLLGGPKGPAEEGGDDDPKTDAAKDALAAFKRNDPVALSLALERHYEACSSAEPVEDDEDTED